MKKLHSFLAALLLIFVVSQTSFAQQSNIWYFGDHAGYSFSPVGTLTGSAMSTNEGCATICDNTGSLLFYTDGISIWDATHALVNPSTPLLGNSSSTQSAVIIPKPGSSNRYFIFTQDEHGLGTCANGLNYSEIDVTAGVVSIVTLNTNLEACWQTTEKITAACHSNGTDYWAVTVNQNGDFVSWPVTSAGVGTAVTSTGIASATTGTDDMVGYMKVSPTGTHLVLARRQWNSVNELFDFNNSTGVVSTNLGTYHTGTAYGAEFSSDGNYFYVSLGFGSVEQYQTASIATHQTLHTGGSIGALQMGPDGNIYVANGYENSNSSYLDMITNVNTYTPTYNDDYITLPAGTHSRLGLPDVVNCFVPNQECEVQSDFQFGYKVEPCYYQFNDISTHGTGTTIVAWEWTFGDGTSSTEQNPIHRYATPGFYTVCLTVYAINGEKCCKSEVCREVEIKEVCDKPCDIKPEFQWSYNQCEPCKIHFWGYASVANTDILAWMWDFGDGTTGTGQTIDHVYGASGVYNVCLTIIGRPDRNGNCCKFKICYQVQVNCPQGGSGHNLNAPGNKNQSLPQIKDQGTTTPGTDNFGLKAYPNPASTNLHVEFNTPASPKVKLQLFDLAGKLQWEGTENNVVKGKMAKNIDISFLPTGIYLLVIEGDDLKITEKIQVIKD